MGQRQLSHIRNQTVGFIFQGFNLVSGLSALENVELPLVYRGMEKKERRQLALDALEQDVYKRQAIISVLPRGTSFSFPRRITAIRVSGGS